MDSQADGVKRWSLVVELSPCLKRLSRTSCLGWVSETQSCWWKTGLRKSQLKRTEDMLDIPVHLVQLPANAWKEQEAGSQDDCTMKGNTWRNERFCGILSMKKKPQFKKMGLTSGLLM